MAKHAPSRRAWQGICCAISVSIACFAHGADLRISIPAPLTAIEAEGYRPFTELANAIGREWHDGRVTIVAAGSVAGSIENVVSGRADVHFPLVAAQTAHDEEFPFRYSTTVLAEIPFFLYSRKDNPRIDPQKLTIAALSKLRIESDTAHAQLFFNIRETANIEDGLQRAAAGKSDGYLYAGFAADPVLKTLRMESLARIPYRRLPVKMVFAKGEASQGIERKLDRIIDKLKASGEYQRLLAPLDSNLPR